MKLVFMRINFNSNLNFYTSQTLQKQQKISATDNSSITKSSDFVKPSLANLQANKLSFGWTATTTLLSHDLGAEPASHPFTNALFTDTSEAVDEIMRQYSIGSKRVDTYDIGLYTRYIGNQVLDGILERGFDINGKYGKYDTTLLYNSINTIRPNIRYIKALIDRGADINIEIFSQNAYECACENRLADAAKILRNHKDFKIDKIDSSGNNTFMNACRCGSLELAKSLYDTGKFNLTDKNSRGENALDLALDESVLKNGCNTEELIKWLYSTGEFTSSLKEKKKYEDRFMQACCENELRVANMLYTLGIYNLTDKNIFGENAFQHALAYKNMLNWYLSKFYISENDIKYAKKIGQNYPYGYDYVLPAIERYQARFNVGEIIERIVNTKDSLERHMKLGLNEEHLNKQDEIGQNALMWALDFNDFELFKKLLPLTKDINAQNIDGDTVLIKASARGLTDFVNAILERKDVKIDIKNNDNLSAIDLSEQFEHPEITKLLNISRPNISHSKNSSSSEQNTVSIPNLTDNTLAHISHGSETDCLTHNPTTKELIERYWLRSKERKCLYEGRPYDSIKAVPEDRRKYIEILEEHISEQDTVGIPAHSRARMISDILNDEEPDLEHFDYAPTFMKFEYLLGLGIAVLAHGTYRKIPKNIDGRR